MLPADQLSPAKRDIRKEEGSILVESAIAIAFLILLFVGMLDIGALIHNYVVVNQVASEAVRYGTRLPVLEEGTWDTNSATRPPGHQQIHDRVNMILAMRTALNVENINITTTFRNTGASDVRADGTVLVSLSADYAGLLPGFDGLNLLSGHRGEYLQD